LKKIRCPSIWQILLVSLFYDDQKIISLLLISVFQCANRQQTIGVQSIKFWLDLQGLASKDRSSPVSVRKRQSYTKVESGNNGIRWLESKMMDRMKKLVDTLIEEICAWINLKSSNLTISLLDMKTTVECHSDIVT